MITTRASFINKYTLPVAAALVGLWLFFLRNALNDTTSFAVFIDNEFFTGPVFSSMSETLRSGAWPTRMDTILGGLPLYNVTQFTPFYPFYLLVLPIYESLAEAVHSMHAITLWHLLILEINLYIFLRVIGAGRVPALTGAALSTFSANGFNYASWINITAPYAWFPLFLAGIVCMAQGKSMPTSSLMTVAGISLLTLASPAQPLIHAVFMAGVFCGFFFWHSRTHDSQRVLLDKFFLPLCGLGALSFLLVAPALVPAAAEMKDMIRWVGDFPPIVGNDRIPFVVFEAQQLAPVDAGGVLFRFRSLDVGHPFIGVVLVGLALLKMLSPRRTWIVNALTFVAVYSLVSSFGSNLGLGYVNYWIPMLNKIREPTRFLFLFQFSICALAALALEELRQIANYGSSMRLVKRQWLALGVLLGLAVCVWLFMQDYIRSQISPAFSIAAFVALLALTWALPKLAVPARGLVLASCWAVVSLAGLAVEVPWFPPLIAKSNYSVSDLAPLDDALARVAELDPSHDYRLVFGGGVDPQTAAMLASYHGIRTLNAYFNPLPKEYFDELYYTGPRDDNYMQMLGAKYLLCKACVAEELKGFDFLESVAGHELYTAAAAFPHVFAVTTVAGTFEHLPDFELAAGHLPVDQPFLFAKASEAPALQLPASATSATEASCSVVEDYRMATEIGINVQCSGAGVVVLNDLHDGNWRASVDGDATLALKVNGNQVGAQVAQGSHFVRFHYRPSIVTGTTILSALSLLLLIYLLCGGRLRVP